VLQRTNIGEQLQIIYEEHKDKPYVGIFSFDKPCLLIRDVELVKNILAKDSQYFIKRINSFDEKLDLLPGKSKFVVKGQKLRRLRTSLNSVFTSGKLKMMFYLVDTCGKELADCLNKTSVYGK
jgi:cytochrome P450 family 6